MNFQEALLLKGVRCRQNGSDRGKISLNCPFCYLRGKGMDTKYRLCVHAVQGWGRCLHCDWKHRWAVAPVLKQLGIMQDDVYAGVDSEAIQQEVVSLPEDYLPLTEAEDDLDLQAKQYILKRGITENQIRRLKIGVSYSGRYAYRVLFPIYADGKLRGINGRDFTGNRQPKYLLSKGDKYLYHFNPKAEDVILSEGVIKALRISQVTRYNSASLLGHSLTDRQLTQIQESNCKRVYLYPDPDRRGYEGVIQIAERMLENWSGECYIIHPVKQPADDAPIAELREVIRNKVIRYDQDARQKLEVRMSTIYVAPW